MQDALCGTTVRGGGPAATALHDLAQLDILLCDAKLAAGRWEALTDAELRAIAARLGNLLNSRRTARLRLPSGKEAIARLAPGVVSIGSVSLGVDVDRPGLHLVQDLPDFSGSNFDLLLATIRDFSSNRPCAGFGVPRLVTVETGIVENFLQWEACDQSKGISPQYSSLLCSSLCALSPQEVTELARHIVERLDWYWSNGGIDNNEAALLRAAGESIAASYEAATLSAVVYDIALHETSLQFTTWDTAYRRGLAVRTIAQGHEHNVVQVRSDPFPQVSEKEVRAVQAMGAEGYIEGFAAAIVEASADGREAVLRRLSSAYQTCVAVPTSGGRLHYQLFWLNGVIRAESIGWQPFTLLASRLSFPQAVPQSVAVASVGRGLAELLELPFPCNVEIQAADVTGSRTTITLSEELRLVSCSEGRIWR